MKKKKTLVLGASVDPNRVSYTAIRNLWDQGHEVIAIGSVEGKVGDVMISTDKRQINENENIDTVTVYLNKRNQEEYEELLIAMKPARIIFNPGAENPGLFARASREGISCMNACTLVMLNFGRF